LLLRQRQKK
jgi:curved DNA-binding protein CbpA